MGLTVERGSVVPPHPASRRPATAPSEWPSNDRRVKPPGRNFKGLTDIFQSVGAVHEIYYTL